MWDRTFAFSSHEMKSNSVKSINNHNVNILLHNIMSSHTMQKVSSKIGEISVNRVKSYSK